MAERQSTFEQVVEAGQIFALSFLMASVLLPLLTCGWLTTPVVWILLWPLQFQTAEGQVFGTLAGVPLWAILVLCWLALLLAFAWSARRLAAGPQLAVAWGVILAGLILFKLMLVLLGWQLYNPATGR